MRPRKPLLYLVVVLPILTIGGVLSIARLMSFYADSKGIHVSDIPDSAGMLIALTAFFVWIPISLFISNLVVQIVPPLRKVARQYSSRSATPSFLASQMQLCILFLAVSIFCVPLIIYGFVR